MVPAGRVDHVVEHAPAVCEHCQAAMAGPRGDADEGVVVVGRHQVTELPPVAVEVTEHRALACRCVACGQVSRGVIPGEVRQSVLGPRLTGAIGMLSASMKGSKRDVRGILQEVLGCELSLGSVSGRERELSDAPHGPYERLVKEVAGAGVKYVDETGWKLKGKGRWLFVAADGAGERVVFRVERNRTREGLKVLLGGDVKTGVFCTDRAGIYDLLPAGRRRQLCWAHLKRDFAAVVERGGEGERVGWELVGVTRAVFESWHRFKEGRCTRRRLGEAITPLRRRMREALEDGAACGQPKTAGLCRALLRREPALWRFVRVEHLEPTNNLAERMLRPAVIWRKKSFGNHSQAGCRYVERMLSVSQTLCLRGRGVLGYLAEAVASHRAGREPPELPTRESAPEPNAVELRGVA
jgi:transposase